MTTQNAAKTISALIQTNHSVEYRIKNDGDVHGIFTEWGTLRTKAQEALQLLVERSEKNIATSLTENGQGG